jgi:predicted AlkP superfamily phosphohydrolase/phosphomutase
VAAVRTATPLTIDDKLTAFLLFFVFPGFLIFVLGRIRTRLGLLVAAALPFLWLALSKDSSDSVLLWFYPVVAALTVVAAARLFATRDLPRKILLASALAFAAALLIPSYSRPAKDLRLLLIGLDGATWNIIDPMVEQGRLPNLQRLLEGGRRAKLRSLPSLLSPQVWTTMCTGCLPEVHGIMGWTNRQSDLPVGRIWDQLKLEDRSFGLCDWYFTWPPEPGDEERDFIIPTHLAPTSLTFPEDYSFYRVIEDLEKLNDIEDVSKEMTILTKAGLGAWRHGIRLSTIRRAFAEVVYRKLGRRDKLDRRWRDRLLYTSIESDLLAELLRTRGPEFTAALFTQIDTVCHTFWKYMEPEGFDEVTPEDIECYGEVIRDVYAETDRGLGKILEFVPPEADVMIVSDHGFEALGEKIAGKSCRIRTLKLIGALGLEEKMFGTNVGTEVYLWAMGHTVEEKEAVLAAVEPALREAHIDGEGEPFFQVSRVDESIHIKIAPRETLPEESDIVLDGRPVGFRRLVRAAGIATESGAHNPDGIYILSGPSAKRGVRSDSLNVVDVTPTIAAILNLPASPLWTGRPAIEGVSLRLASAGDYPAPSGSGDEPERINQELIDRLKALGYLE